MASSNNPQAFTRLTVKEPDTNRVVGDLYDKLATVQRQITDLQAQLAALAKKVP